MPVANAKKVAILGFHEGNAGQTADWFEAVSGYEIDCFFCESEIEIDLNPMEENKKRNSQRMEYPCHGQFKGKPFFSVPNWIHILRERGVSKILPLESENAKRFDILQKARQEGFELVSAIHPSAQILSQATLYPGIWIHANATIGYKAEIFPGAMINTGAIIEHHCILESCSQVDPGVVMGGHVTLRERSHVHLGARIINKIEIGADAEIGAGSLVLHSVPPRSIYVGSPAKLLRTH